MDDDACGYKYHSYQIDGIGINSPELVFNVLSPPLPVSIGQSFHIWFGEDLHDCGDDNNSGETCADVYAWYTTQANTKRELLFRDGIKSDLFELSCMLSTNFLVLTHEQYD